MPTDEERAVFKRAELHRTHRCATCEAEARNTLDEERLARALRESAPEWLFRDHMDTYEKAATLIAKAYREDTDA